MSIVLLGSTSGSCTLQEQAVAGTTTLTLPTFNGTVGLLVSGTAVASTSGTSVDITGIPAGVRRVTIMFNNVSTSGTSNPIIRLGTAGGIDSSANYYAMCGNINTSGAASAQNYTTGFGLLSSTASNVIVGQFVITLLSADVWLMSGTFTQNTSNANWITGRVPLSGVLTQLRVTTLGGTDTFDAGSINILYE
jgi:hypothetical protein